MERKLFRRKHQTPDSIPPAAPEPRERRSITQALKDTFGDTVFDRAKSPSTQMAVALNAKNGPTYAGTVHKATIAKRRAANKAARHARALHRSRR